MNRSRASRAVFILVAAASVCLCSGRQTGHGSALWVPEAVAQTAPAAEPNLAPVTLTPQRIQSIGVKTGVVEFRPVSDEIRTVGNVEADETRLADVQVRFAGWVQKVYADATYKQKRQGQPLLTIYSPELVTAEQDYLVASELLALSTGPGGAAGSHGFLSLLNAATERLKQWQVPDREIARLKKSGKIRRELEIALAPAPVARRNIDERGGTLFIAAAKFWQHIDGVTGAPDQRRLDPKLRKSRGASPRCAGGWPSPPADTHSNACLAAKVQSGLRREIRSRVLGTPGRNNNRLATLIEQNRSRRRLQLCSRR